MHIWVCVCVCVCIQLEWLAHLVNMIKEAEKINLHYSSFLYFIKKIKKIEPLIGE